MTRRQIPSSLRRPPGVRSGRLLWEACCAGREPAEALDPRDREDLVAGLVESGWADVEIAVHTRMSTYTAARIRDRVGARPNFGPEHMQAALIRIA